MSKLKENFEFFTVILAIIVMILLFLSTFLQIPVFIDAFQYECETAYIEQLTDKEMDAICLGEPCNYSHKIIFDNHSIKVANSGIQFTDKIWVYFKVIGGKKVFIDRSNFLYAYFIFDLTSIGYLILFYFYMKNEKAKENSKESKPLSSILKKKKSKNSEFEKDTPLPPFRGVFLAGYLQFALCFVGAYFLAKSFPGSEWTFSISFLLPFLSGFLLYFLTKKSIAFFLSSLLCLAPAATGKDILYIDHLLNPTTRPLTENVFTLPVGELMREYTGSFVSVISSGSRNRSKSYYYHFVAPYKTESEPLSHWLTLKQEWLEDETKFELFWEVWKQKRLAVQIFDEESSLAITRAGNRYQLDLSKGVALLKPILSLEEEIETTFYNVFWTDSIALLLWTIIGLLRLYAGRK